jgi:hypothetical protein
MLDHDLGFAPNPEGDYCTLVHCKFGGRAGHKNIVELAAAAIAKKHGASVISTTRNASRESLLRSSGADDVVIDTGSIAEGVRDKYHEGVDKVLELIGTASLLDSLRCVKEGGVVCMTGIVGNKWSFDNFAPMDAIPTAVRLTAGRFSISVTCPRAPRKIPSDGEQPAQTRLLPCASPSWGNALGILSVRRPPVQGTLQRTVARQARLSVIWSAVGNRRSI